MTHAKKTPQGIQERKSVLEEWYPGIEKFIRDVQTRWLRRKIASLNDLLDASTAAITGLGGSGRLETIPDNPPTDMYGLKMEMVYRRQ